MAIEQPDDLDEVVWEHNHAVRSRHLAWRTWRRFTVHRQSWWNGLLWNIGMRLDPPKGEPKAGEALWREK